MSQDIGFYGAARTVTGSRHLLTLGKSKILVDCGMFQGGRELREKNDDPFPFIPSELDGVILTHGHTDHIGLLPRLVKEGYRGPVWATHGTIGLCQISLPDSAKIQEEDARYRSRHGHASREPLYDLDDARAALKLMRPLSFFQFQDIPGRGTFRFLPAGHILGSAFAEIYFEDGQRILMSGDIGRWNRPILKDPTAVDFAEYLVLESTYGDRVHSEEDPLERLETLLNDVHDNRRVLLVPSFAIGRTQELLWCINELQKQNRCPRVPVYVDSPMANAATLLYAKHTEDMDKEVRIDMAEGRSPFDPQLVRFVRDAGMSKALNNAPGPMVIISGSGMASGGRIQHHLRHRLRHPETLVLFTGYQAGGTLGRELLEGATEVEFFGDTIPVQAEITKLNSLSAHADQPEMLAWLRGFKEPPKKTFLVHGEPEVQDTWAAKIRAELGWEVVVPEEGQVEVLQ